MAKKKKFQSGAASFLDDPDSLGILPMIQKPNLQGGKDPNLLDLGPLLGMAIASGLAANVTNQDTEAKLRDRGIIVPPDELSEEDKKRLGVYGGPVGGGFTQLGEEDRIPTVTGGEPPEAIDPSPPPFPLPDEKTFEDMTAGGGFTQLEEKDKIPPIITMGKEKKESKALVPTKMMENIDDIKITGDGMNPRFNKTEDYIKSNYSGNEKKKLNDWVNELYADDKGLNLELRDTGASAALNALNQDVDPDRDFTAKEVLELFQDNSFPKQLATENFSSYKIMGKDQNLLPQLIEVANQTVKDITDPRPGPISDAIERIKFMDLNFYQRLAEATNSEQAADIIAQRNASLLDIIDESGVPKQNFTASKEFTLLQDEFRKVNEGATRNVFTNEHMTVGLPGTDAADYIVMTHNFNPAYNQSNKISAHNDSHPTDDFTIAFSRSRLITNQNPAAENANGIIIMEMQSDVHRTLKSGDIEFPTQENEFKGGDNFYPFSGGAQYWVKQVLKDNIENAVKNNLDFVGWSPGEVVSVYENASDAQDRKGYNTIYNAKTSEFIKKINKDIAKRGKQLGLNKEQIESTQLVVKDDAIYFFPGRDNRYSDTGTATRYTRDSGVPNIDQYASEGEAGGLVLKNMPYIDLKAEGFNLELFKKIGLPQFKKGGKTNEDMGDPLIDIEIFMKSV